MAALTGWDVTMVTRCHYC